MKLFNEDLNKKESAYIRWLYRNISDEAFNQLSDQEILHRILLKAMGENNKRHWSKEELALLDSNLSSSEIAKKLNRSCKSVYNMRSRKKGANW